MDGQENYKLHNALKDGYAAGTSVPHNDGNSIADSVMEDADSLGDGDKDEDTDMMAADEKVCLPNPFHCESVLTFWCGLHHGNLLIQKHACLLQRSKKGRHSEAFKELILGILQENEFEDQRSAKLTQVDFLRLLASFNASGVHFTS